MGLIALLVYSKKTILTMRNYRKLVLIVFLVSGSLFGWATNLKPFVVPELTQWQGGEGQMQPSGQIVVASPALRSMAQTFCHDYTLLTGRQMSIVTGNKAKAGDIVLRLKKDKALGSEGYRMAIGTTCDITAATPKALYWGLQTVLQLSEQQPSLPCGSTVDKPQYAIRGFMLDVGRKFVPMPYIKKLARIMAYYKMNTLQLHLNDNGFKQYFDDDWMQTPSAFRLECDTYPGLAAKDGHYTKAEFRTLVKEAAAQFVDIIPEIDSPGHVLAFTQYKPSLASEKYGMDHFDIFNPEVYTFMDNLFKEYLSGKDPVFAGKYVHIGTDEYSNATQELKEKFRAYTDRYLALIESYGKSPMVWGALSHADGTTPVRQKGVTMGLWSNDMADPVEMKRQGWKMISMTDWQTYIVPIADYYHDYLPLDNLYNTWTPRVFRNVTLEENDPCIVGGMFALWNDIYGNGITVADMHDRIFPVLQVIADKTWTAALTTLPFDLFEQKKGLLSEAPGVNEMGRTKAPMSLNEVKAGHNLGLPVSEVGFGHRITFTVDCKAEAKGTVLFYGPQSTFFLADPVTGRLGYQREDYLDTFNYTLPTEGEVELTIETTPAATTLYVNGVKRETLAEQRLYVIDKEKSRYDKMPNVKTLPHVWQPTTSMRYLRALFFPLQKAGAFKSNVKHLNVESFK